MPRSPRVPLDDEREVVGKAAEGPAPLTYAIGDVETITGFRRPTIYEHARRDPRRWGVVRVGRAMRFRRDAIHRLVDGHDQPA